MKSVWGNGCCTWGCQRKRIEGAQEEIYGCGGGHEGIGCTEDRKITIILNPGCQLIELITRLTEINDFLR